MPKPRLFGGGKAQLADMRLRLGLRRSLICFAPLAFVPQRQTMKQSKARFMVMKCPPKADYSMEPPRGVPSPSVFFLISTDFTPPPGIPASPEVSKKSSSASNSSVEPKPLTGCLPFRLRDSLRPVNPDNARALRITAAAGT